MSYRQHKAELLEIVAAVPRRPALALTTSSSARARARPAEINLRATDIANMGLARAAQLPVLVVGDINRGGVFAALFGTLALLSPEDQALVCGFVVNKFRGDVALLEPGLDMLQRLTGRPTLGVLPWTEGLELDVEDSLGLSAPVAPVPPLRRRRAAGVGRAPAAPVELDRRRRPPQRAGRARALRHDAGGAGRRRPRRPAGHPRDRGRPRVAAAARTRRRRCAARAEGRPVLGICGGYQMLGTRDRRRRRVAGGARSTGSGCCRCGRRSARDKMLGRPTGAYGAHPVTTAYEIHHGGRHGRGRRAGVRAGRGLPGRRGARHGLARRARDRRRPPGLLREVAPAAGRDWRPGTMAFEDVRQARLDALGDLVADHLDTAAVLRLLEGGAPTGLPFVPPGAP